MFRSLLLVMLSSLALLAPATADQKLRQISWEDLVSPTLQTLKSEADDIGRSLESLSAEEREQYFEVQDERYLREQIRRGFIAEDSLKGQTKALLTDSPSAKFPDAVKFWDRVDALNEVIRAENVKANPTLDGQTIRMPGYMLPLEFDGEAVTEFLLVPYVGACIHSPPPPSNQIVFVRADQGVEAKGLFKPIWIEGTMKIEQGSHRLSLVDGEDDVAASYALKATRIEDYVGR